MQAFQFSIKNMFQGITALAAVLAWFRFNCEQLEYLYPGHAATAGIIICLWGTAGRLPSWLAVQVLLMGFLLFSAGLVDAEFSALMSIPCSGDIRHLANYAQCRQQLLVLPPLWGVVFLPRLLSLSWELRRHQFVLTTATVAVAYGAALCLVAVTATLEWCY